MTPGPWPPRTTSGPSGSSTAGSGSPCGGAGTRSPAGARWSSCPAARVELAACPLSQLADAWNRRTVGKESLPDLRALPPREHEEIDGLTLELKDTASATAARRVFGLLSAVDGLEAGREPPRP